MKTCENCGNEHKGKYGSGRFCSTKCSRGFSTKAKRTEINAKVSAKLKKEKKEAVLYDLVCEICKSTFKGKPHRKYCSMKCIGVLGGNAIKKDTSKMGGVRDGGGRTKTFEYVNLSGESMKLNIEEIKLAKILDELKLDWKRNTKGFPYISKEGNRRNFYPDFYINKFDCYVEYKGWVTSDMIHKMDYATKENELKLLIVYGNEKRYRNLGLTIDQICEDPKILITHLELLL